MIPPARTFLPAVFLFLLALFAPLAHASEPLEAERAFAMRARPLDAQSVEIRFDVESGYYLYGDRFRFEATPPEVVIGVIERAPGKRHTDPFFGEVETYRGALRMRLKVEAPPGLRRFTLAVTSQGCWDGGVCYPPVTQHADIELAAPGAGAADDGSGDETGRLAGLLASSSVPWVLAMFFGFGLLLVLTPCVYPMIPILSGIIVGTKASAPRALALSLAYVLGMAFTYAAAGVIAGLSGSLLSAMLQNTWVLLAFALVFVLLALSMFGLFELRLPSSLQNRLANAANRGKGGGLGGVAAMGALSALVVSPCMTAPLAGALLYIAKTGDAALGGSALFTLALGMGTPLIVVALAARSLLPKSGPWMGWAQKAGGVMLLAAALWIIWPVLTTPGKPASQSHSMAAATPAFEHIGSMAELDARLAATDRPVLLDFYADWCVTCKEMERDTFSHPSVAARMARMKLLQVDVTAYKDTHKALLQRFGLVGPPGIVFFDARGQLRKDLRVVGFMPPEAFAALLDRAL